MRRPTCSGPRSGSGAATPSADLADEPFARAAIERLEEIRLAAIERRIDAELALGLHAELVGELQELVAAHPFGERFTRQLMLALYRSGRQTEALTVYRATREALVEQFGIEPTPSLRRLERAILTQDRSLDLAEPDREATARPRRPVLVLPSEERAVDGLLGLAAPLASVHARELIVARLLADGDDVAAASAALNARREALDLDVRTAAFTTSAWADDADRLASTSDVALVLLDAPSNVDGAQLPGDLAALLERSAADVGLLAGPAPDGTRGEGVFVPFGGGRARLGGSRARRLARLCDGSAAPARRDEGGRESGPAGREPAARRCCARCPTRRRRRRESAAGRAERRQRSSPPSSRRRSSCSASHRDGGWTASVRRGGHSCATRARRRCSSTAGLVLEASRRARAARASPGRSSSRERTDQEQTLSLSAM